MLEKLRNIGGFILEAINAYRHFIASSQAGEAPYN